MLIGNMASGDRYKTALTCGLCQDTLTDPKTLPCLHYYCLKCLHTLVENSKLEGGFFNCPECHHECNVPQEGVGEFGASPTVTFSLDAYKDNNQTQGPECYTCWDDHQKHTTASTQCLDCNKTRCTSCCKWHDSFSQDHNELDLSGDKASDLQTALQSIKERNVFCEKHPSKPIELYCKVDKTVLCHLCYSTNHAGHTCEDIKVTAAKHMQPFGAVITQGKQLVDVYEKAIQQTQAYKGELEKNAENVTAAIKNDMNALIQTIQTKYKCFTEQVLKEKESNIKQVMSHLRHLELHKAITEGQVNKYCTLVKHGHPAEIASLGEQINKNSEEWSKQPKLDFNTKLGIKFIDSKVDEDSLEFGKVQVEKVPGQEELKPLCEPAVEQRKLQDHSKRDLIVTKAGDYVTTDLWSETSKIYDRNFKLKKDTGKDFSHVTLTADNNLAFTGHSNTISVYHPDGTHTQDIVCERLSILWGIALNPLSGDLLVCDDGTKTVYHINPTTGDITDQTKPGTFKDSYYITCSSKGVILVSDNGANCIKGIDQEGNEVFSYGEEGAGDQQLYGPCGICTDTSDYIFLADWGNNRVHLLSPEGDFIKYVLTEEDGLSGPLAVTIHDGKLLVGDNAGQLFTVKYRE